MLHLLYHLKNLLANARDARDTSLIPGLGRSPGVGNGNPLQYSCLENSMDRRAWRATVHGVTKSRTQLGESHTHTHTHTYTAITQNHYQKTEHIHHPREFPQASCQSTPALSLHWLLVS